MKRILYCIVPLCLSAPLFAQAAEGYVVADISLQAGPDSEYPSIVELAAGTPVEVEGCINGFTWCDVVVGDNRGWVAGSYVQEQYDNQPVIIEDYGPRIGIPIVAFSLGIYWGEHYHNHPFYAQREHWESRHIQSHTPPRPSAIAIRNMPHNSGHPDTHGAPPRPATVQQVQRPQPQEHVVATPERTVVKTAPVKTKEDIEHERIQSPKPVVAPKEVQVPKETQQRTTVVQAHAPPKVESKPKVEPKPIAEPKPEEKKDDGGHKEDPKDH